MILTRILFLGAVAAACTRPESEQRMEPAASSSTDTARPWRKPGDKVDSILPMPEYLRRFRQGLTEPARLTGGAATREALARRFLVAVSARDTAALAALAVSRAEFAWLVFPDHIYARPPYELDPEIFWMQLTAESAKGAHRTLELYGGARLALLSMGCQRDTMQLKWGPVRIWSDCELRYRAGDSVLTRRLFGSIVERDGRMKLLSFANGG
jgi:hypothetical protein